MDKGGKRCAPDQTVQDQTKSKSWKLDSGKPPVNEGTLCGICNKNIIEQSSEHDGEDAIRILQ